MIAPRFELPPRLAIVILFGGEALTAKDGLSSGWTKRQRCFLAATRADGSGFALGRALAGCLCGSPVRLASRTAARQIRELLLMKKELLVCGEYERSAALSAGHFHIFEFHGPSAAGTSDFAGV